MHIREYSLPQGWYPRDPDEIRRFLNSAVKKGQFRAAIAPHAGWFYSGRLAADAVSSLDRAAQTIVILGGHLPGKNPPLFAMEDAVRTPFGPMPIDTDLRSILLEKLSGKGDSFKDNTIEVLLPMARFFFPDAMLLWLRLPAEISSFDAGKTIAFAAQKLGRKINILASADLTHYGHNYGFCPHGSGEKALKWVKEVNDYNFIRAIEEGNADEALKLAEIDKASCSAGAVLGAMGFAEAADLPKARLLGYSTSADITGENTPGSSVPASFVGYAALVFG